MFWIQNIIWTGVFFGPKNYSDTKIFWTWKFSAFVFPIFIFTLNVPLDPNIFNPSLMLYRTSNLLTRGGKRGGAREHCSKKEVDQTILGRRILAKCTALVTIFKKKAFNPTSSVGLDSFPLPLIENTKVHVKYLSSWYRDHNLKEKKNIYMLNFHVQDTIFLCKCQSEELFLWTRFFKMGPVF